MAQDPCWQGWARLMLKPRKAAWHTFLTADDKQRGLK